MIKSITTDTAFIAIINGKHEIQSIRYRVKDFEQWCLLSFIKVCRENGIPQTFKSFSQIEQHCSIRAVAIVFNDETQQETSKG